MDSRTRQMLTVGGIALGGFLFWSLTKKASAANAPAGGGLVPIAPESLGLPSGLYAGAPGPSGTVPIYQSTLPAPTVVEVAQQSGIWANLQAMSASPFSGGYVNFPSGAQAASALLPWRTDGANFYTQWAGTVYAVPVTSDAQGNYTAVTA